MKSGFGDRWTCDAFGLYDPGAALFIAQLAPGQDVAKSSAEFLSVLESVATEPITAEELQRAQTNWLKSWELSFTNPETIGVALSESVAQGDWRLFFLTRDRIKALTLADVQRVATERLLASNRTLATYIPTEQPQRAPAPQQPDIAAQFKGFKPQAAAAAVAAFDTSPANIDANTQRFTLASGMKAALLPKPTRGGAVRASLVLHFGDEKSLANQGEVPAMVASMLDEGTAKLTRQQIRDRLDQLQSELLVSPGTGAVARSSELASVVHFPGSDAASILYLVATRSAKCSSRSRPQTMRWMRVAAGKSNCTQPAPAVLEIQLRLFPSLPSLMCSSLCSSLAGYVPDALGFAESATFTPASS